MVHIGSGSGFAGDRFDAAVPVVQTLSRRSGPKYLVYEVMAERTLAYAQKLRNQDPLKGYSPWLDLYLPEVLADCKAHQIRIVANFGNANTVAAGRRVLQMAVKLGIKGLRVAIVQGDDLLPNYSQEALLETPCIEGTTTHGRPLLAANAYLGARPIAKALALGVDVVLVGRTTDAALVLGPLIHEFQWADSDYDQLAAGTLAGHLLECGSQVSGGYFADPGLKNVPELYNVGFPIAKISREGVIEIRKAENTGGLVNRATVSEQMLYEVHDPANYLTPDVILDLTGVKLLEKGDNCVELIGAKGRPPTGTLKVTLSLDGGWLGEAEVSYAGQNALARTTLAAEIVRKRCQKLNNDLALRIEIIGTDSVYASDSGRSFEPQEHPSDGEYRLRAAVRNANQACVQQVVDEVLALLCCGPAGGGGVRQSVTSQVSTASILWPRERIEKMIRVIEVSK